MGVKLTADAERERVKIKPQNKSQWEYLRTVNIIEAMKEASKRGWADKKVQVRLEPDQYDQAEYVVEPYEEGCGCKNIVQYNKLYDKTLEGVK